ncbi:unnamed protein product [Paramecium sonneborni]|uniref:Uncharacterized protein n=1 Tax=Paramecium sonneborni TaxID=65129 RepID=A0A8S1LKK1_9CILI|nr:unnamed protein product [Paramecium sonneborni]
MRDTLQIIYAFGLAFIYVYNGDIYEGEGKDYKIEGQEKDSGQMKVIILAELLMKHWLCLQMVLD